MNPIGAFRRKESVLYYGVSVGRRLKRFWKYIKKKRGFALLETLIVISILIVLISLYAKQNFVNLRKSNYYGIKEDILTLNSEEEQLIKVAENKISLDIELMRKLEEEGIEEKIIYTSSNDNNLYIELLDKDIYLIHKKNLERKYRKLE